MDDQELDRLFTLAGINRKIFDDGSQTEKSASERLLDSLKRRQMVIGYSPIYECLESVRKSVAPTIVTRKRRICETGRRYHKGRPVMITQPWSISGTPGWDQSYYEAAAEEMEQETKLVVSPDQFRVFRAEYWDPPLDKPPRPSRIYGKNLLSRVLVCPLILELPEKDLDLPQNGTFDDDEKTIFYESFDPEPPYMIGFGKMHPMQRAHISIHDQLIRDIGNVSMRVPRALIDALVMIDKAHAK